MSQSNELAYRRSAIEGASPIGLLIALYDTLWGDLRRAAAAIRKNDIELRCRELNHAALVLGQLEDWVDVKNGGDLAQNLTGFYSYLRAKMLEAGINKSAALLEEQMELILHVRSAWQQRDLVTHPIAVPATGESGFEARPSSAPTAERVALSFSA
jgi:flagellar secretion chaperone FliS